MGSNALGWSDPSDYLQNALGVPVTVTSGLRTPQHNAAVRGVPNSDHLRGQAYDFVPQGMSMSDAAAKLASSGIPTTKIINEQNHIHVSYPAQGQMAQNGISDDDLLKALTGGGVSSPKSAAAPQGNEYPAGDSRNLPATMTITRQSAPQPGQMTDEQLLSALTGAASAKVASPPPLPKSPSAAISTQAIASIPLTMASDVALKLPFAKDVVAGGTALLDKGADLISGKAGPSLSNTYQANMNALAQQQKAYEAAHPILAPIASGLSVATAGSPAAGLASAPQTLGQLVKGGAKAGATLGGLFGAGTATEGPQTVNGRAGNALVGAATGAGLGAALPVAAVPVAAAGRLAGSAANRLFPPMDQKAAMAAKGIIDKFAGGQPLTPNTAQIVPGSAPTLAESVDNPGVSLLQKQVTQLNPNSPLLERQAQNAAARNAHANSIVGTPEDIEAIKEARNDTGDSLREAAFANSTDTDVKGVKSAINKVLASPAGQRDVVASSLSKVRDKLDLDYPLSERVGDAISPIKDAISSGSLGVDKLADFTEARRLLNSANRGHTSEDDLVSGLSALAKKQKIVGPIDNALRIVKSGGVKLESDPAQLYGIRQSITDMLSPLAQGTKSDARLASGELQGILKNLDNAIEKGAPGYKNYMDTFSSMSKPANAMEFLQSKNLRDSKGNVTLAQVNNAINALDKEVAKPGVRAAKSVSSDQRDSLVALRDDLLRASKLDAGKARGSDTAQNTILQESLGLAGQKPGFLQKYGPELSGATIGAGLGHMTGIPQATEAGAFVGDRLGKYLGERAATRAAQSKSLLQGHLENMLLNPQAYSAPPVQSLPPTLNQLMNGSRVRTGLKLGNNLAILHELGARNATGSP